MAFARILILTVALSAPAIAAEDAPASERRLSPEQVDKVLSEAARKREGAARQEPVTDSDSAPMPVRGEVGFSIGTGGYRSAYGTAIVDLPGGGAASLWLGTQRFPEHHFYPYR